MGNELSYSHCAEGFGLRSIRKSEEGSPSLHFQEQEAAYRAMIDGYRLGKHPFERHRHRVVWRKGDVLAGEPKANLYLAPDVRTRLLKDAPPLPGRVYLLLALAEGTPGWAVRKVAADCLLAGAASGGSLSNLGRTSLEDMLLRILAWPETDPDFPGEWGLTAPEGLTIPPALEAARALVSSVLTEGRVPTSARAFVEAGQDEAPTRARWVWTLCRDEELETWSYERAGLPLLEAARKPAAFGSEFRIRMKERALFPDGLEVLYRGTSHKRGYPDDPAVAMPHLDLTQACLTELIEPKWTVGPNGWCEGETRRWGPYEIEVRGLDYDREVALRVIRR